MSALTRMWIQLGGAAFFAVVTAAELVGWKQPTFGVDWGPFVLAGGGLVMLYQAWRSWRKHKQLPVDLTEPADSKMDVKKEIAE